MPRRPVVKFEVFRYVKLAPPEDPDWLTVLHPLRATSAAEHVKLVREWATSVWNGWSHHHARIRGWAAEVDD